MLIFLIKLFHKSWLNNYTNTFAKKKKKILNNVLYKINATCVSLGEMSTQKREKPSHHHTILVHYSFEAAL